VTHQQTPLQPLPPQQAGEKTFCRPNTSTALVPSAARDSELPEPAADEIRCVSDWVVGQKVHAAKQLVRVPQTASHLSWFATRQAEGLPPTHTPVRWCSRSSMRRSSASTSGSRCAPSSSRAARDRGGFRLRTPLLVRTAFLPIRRLPPLNQ
jgi:hypothetical protein